MTIEEVSRVLAKIKLGDNREVNELVIAEWNDSIGFLPYKEAIEAVTVHRRESTEYLQPAHIVRNVKRVQAGRERDARIQSQFARAALPAKANTLDRAEFDRLTDEAIAQRLAAKS